MGMGVSTDSIFPYDWEFLHPARPARPQLFHLGYHRGARENGPCGTDINEAGKISFFPRDALPLHH